MNPAALEARLLNLERSLAATRRRQRQLGLLALLLGSALFAIGAAEGYTSVADVLRVKRLEITDDNGLPVLTLDVGKWGGVLEITNRQQTTQLKLQAFETGGMLTVMNADGQLTSGFSNITGQAGNGGVLRLLSANGQPVVELGASREQDGQLRLSRADGQSLIYAGANQTGNGMVRISGKDGEPSTVLLNRPALGGHVEVYSPGGQPAGYLRANGEGLGEMRAYTGRK